MGIAQDHVEILPAAELLEHLQRRAVHDVPAGPGVAKVVEGEVLDAGAGAGLVPCGGGEAAVQAVQLGRLLVALVDEHPFLVSAFLLGQDVERVVIQRHRDGVAGFGLASADPCGAARGVDLVPLQPGDVGRAEPRGQREAGHAGQVWRQLGDEARGLFAGDPARIALVLVAPVDRRRADDPFVCLAIVEDLRKLGQGAIAGAGRAAPIELFLAGGERLGHAQLLQLADLLAVDVGDLHAGQVLREPPQPGLDVF
ncbi:MAG: hypothetical protein JNM76_14840 [Betaproteobacteria bacterium]|nr:hypothetical protein [Betaproteobacteria bacterium]